jgi:hypothetical protein
MGMPKRDSAGRLQCPLKWADEQGGRMRSHRAPPRVKGKSSRKRVLDAAPMVGADDGDDFPIDDLPPDDLPVREITEDQEQRHPAHNVAITAADQAGRGLADPTFGPSAGNLEPGSILSGSNHPPPRTAQHHEPVAEASAPGPQPKADAAELPTQYLFLDLVSDDPVKARLGLGGKQAVGLRPPRGSPRKRARKAAQIELWPDDEPLIEENCPR